MYSYQKLYNVVSNWFRPLLFCWSTQISQGVPHGSILGPVLLVICMLPLSSLIRLIFNTFISRLITLISLLVLHFISLSLLSWKLLS